MIKNTIKNNKNVVVLKSILLGILCMCYDYLYWKFGQI